MELINIQASDACSDSERPEANPAPPRAACDSPLGFSHAGDSIPHRLRAVAFDLDAASLISLREAFPGCEIELLNGATAASLTCDWDPGTVDLLVVQAREEAAETLGLCRFLVSCGVLATDSEDEVAETLRLHRSGQDEARHVDAPLLVLVRPERGSVVRAALKAGAHSCLLLPIYAKEVAGMLARARQGNQPGRHTLNLDRAQRDDRWRDDGGQG